MAEPSKRPQSTSIGPRTLDLRGAQPITEPSGPPKAKVSAPVNKQPTITIAKPVAPVAAEPMAPPKPGDKRQRRFWRRALLVLAWLVLVLVVAVAVLALYSHFYQ